MPIVTAAIQDEIRAAGFHVGAAKLLLPNGTVVWQVEAMSAESAERWAVTAQTEADATVELAVRLGFDLEE